MQGAQVNKKVIGPSAKTAQGFSTPFMASPDGKWLGYCVKNTAVIRNMDDMNDSRVFTKHTSEVTAIAFHPNGELAASADVKANVHVWSISKLTSSKKLEGAFTGKINGLEFSDDGKLLLLFGESKQFYGKVISWEKGDDVAGLGNFHKNVLAGAFSKDHKSVMLGGEENMVNYYNGSSYPFKCSQKEHTVNKFITTIKCSPDGTKFVSSGFDKKVIVYDANDGKVLDQFDASKVTNGHKMAIMASCFLDNDRYVTASYDRSVKIWNLKDKTLLMTLIPKQDKKLDNSFMMCGVATNGKKIASISLGGTIYVWNADSLADNKLPDLVLCGHQASISYVTYSQSSKELISGDADGKVLVHPENDAPKLVVKKDSKIARVKTTCDDSLILVLMVNGDLFGYSRDKFEEKLKAVGIGGTACGLAPSRKNKDLVYLLTSNCLAKVDKGNIAKKVKTSYCASALEINEELGEVLVGDDKGKLHVLDMDLNEKSANGAVVGEFTAMALSPDGKLIATGDNHKYINLLKSDTKEKLCEFGDHNAKIFDLGWSSDSKLLVSGSLDYNVGLWDVENKKNLKFFQNVNDNAINTVCFANDNKEVVCGGLSCSIEKLTL